MLLTSHRYCSLRTFRRSGEPVDTPVWFATSDTGAHYIFSAGEAGKVKRLRNSSQAQVASCDARGGSLGQWQDARAWLVNDPDETELAYQLLIQKYGWQMHLTNFFSRLAGKIHQRQVIRLETTHAT